MGMNVDNCPRCGKLYVKGFRDLCQSCIKLIDQEYESCMRFLRDKRKATIQELHEETGVTIKQITTFIREGRISLAGLPNMNYSCEICAGPIRDGNMCDSCRKRLVKDIRNSAEDSARKEEQLKQNKSSYNIQDRLKDRLK